MCGIAGFIDFTGGLDESTLRRMQGSLRHRGPDDQGHVLLTEGNARIGLAHTRLSILDLSAAGHQPMRLGPFSIVYNGEIYNFREIRADLTELGHDFVTDCDTEVILHAFAEWGMRCLDRFIGMFAFVLHDANSRQIYFIRDRAGVKPLYVHTGRGFWLFGSELKALRSCLDFHPSLDLAAVRAFFRHGHVPDQQCIYQQCHKVDAGTYWVVDTESLNHRVVRWWDQTALYHQEQSRSGFEESVDELQELLHSACAYRMVSDVPVGVFLSGGYDSSAVAAILQSSASKPIKTFTIGFTEGNDEAPAAREIARVLGTEHHEFYCSPKEALDIVPKLPEIYDEPFADSSGIPTILVSQMARQHVKVALSADGGDELFAGYNSYPASWRRIRRMRRIPPALRGVSSAALGAGARLLPAGLANSRHKLEALSHAMARSDALMAQRLHGHSRLMPRSMIDALIAPGRDQCQDFEDRAWPAGTHPLDACLGLDYQTYLKDDILTKVDRATMSVGLEGREPLLDHRLAAFAARMPMHFKYDGHIGKRALREVVHRHIPRRILDRPKTGFSLPLMKWLREDLRPLLNDLLSPESLRKCDSIDSQTAQKWVQHFHARNFHYSPLVWRLFVFLAWQRHWRVND